MKRPASPIIAALVLSLFAYLLEGSAAAQDGEAPAGTPGLRFEVLENRSQGGFAARLTIDNPGPGPLPAAGWELYFSFARAIAPASVRGGVEIARLNGDFVRLAPTAEFGALAAGASRSITFEGRGLLLKECDAPAGPYFVFAAGASEPRRVEAVSDYTLAPWPAWTGGGPGVPAAAPTAASRFEAARAAVALPAIAPTPPAIVPTPLAVTAGEGRLEIDASWTIDFEPGLEREAGHLQTALAALLGVRPATGSRVERRARALILRRGAVPAATAGAAKAAGAEYHLSATPGRGVEIVGGDAAGVFYGIQSLLALLPVEAFGKTSAALPIPAIAVTDAPRFAYRGLHLDVARNFQSRATVEKLIDLMAFYKLNRLHLHLTDDEGWRVAIAGLPELTAVGGRRGHTLDDREHLTPSFGSGPHPDAAGNHGSGHYSRADFVAILRHAAARHIEVVPEIDVPGHARAAIKAMAAREARLGARAEEGQSADEITRFRLTDPEDRSPYRSVQGWSDNVIDVCLESSYRFLATVFDDLAAMFAEAGAPLTALHVGGDEVPAGVWEKSPACARLIGDTPGLDGVDELPHYFLDRVSAMLLERGLITAGWEEIALAEVKHGAGASKNPNPAFVDRRFRPYIWNSVWGWGAEDLGNRLANAGYEVVLSNATNLYFDLAYDRDPAEPGYTWAGTVDTRKAFEFTPLDVFRSARENRLGHPLDGGQLAAGRARLSAEGRTRVLGIQGQIWGENAKGREAMEHLAFPKTLALAERAWAAQPAWAREDDPRLRAKSVDEAWNRFARLLGERELPRLDFLAGGVAYRLPPPGAIVDGGTLHANVTFAGLAIRYTTDGSEPTAGSALYAGPTPVSGPARLRTFDRRGRGSRTTVAAAD